MKKMIFTLVAVIFAMGLFAQSPLAFNYQAVIRDASGDAVSEQYVSIKISLLENSISGPVAYSETHAVQTSEMGLVVLQIGTGDFDYGSFSDLQWVNYQYFMKVELDLDAGTDYIEMGTTQLLSVPYALYAESSGPAGSSGQTLRHNGSGWIADTLIYNDGTKVGVGTNNPSGKLEVKGQITDSAEAPLFEVKDKDGNTVFAVYPDGAVLFVKDGEPTSTSGFSIKGRDGSNVSDVTRITPDSIRFFVRENEDDKASNRGGFAVTGRATNKGEEEDFLRVTPDSVRIYVKSDNDDKSSNRGGFAVTGRATNKGLENEYLRVTPDSVRIYIDDSADGGYGGGFGVGSFGSTDSLFLQSDKSGLNVVYLSTLERDAISTPRMGSVIFNTTDSCMQIYLGYWESIWCTPINCVYPVVQTNPANASFTNGSDTAFVVEATGSKLYYKWQESRDGGTTWAMINDGGTNPKYVGAYTSTLELRNIPSTHTNYAYRCLIINACGDVLSNPALLTSEWMCGDSFVDSRDGKTYSTVQIGLQCWMAQNLNVGVMVSSTMGGSQQTNNGIIEKYCNSNNEANCHNRGGLYEWGEMMQYNPSENGVPGTTQGICPDGWHLPTHAEWSALYTTVGGITVAARELKQTGLTYWQSPNNGLDNFGFTAIPHGRRHSADGSFSFFSQHAQYSCATEISAGNNYWMEFHHQFSDVIIRNDVKTNGQSVRCIKN